MSRTATWTTPATVLAMLASLLAACHTTRVVWAKPGGDIASLRDDMQACNYHPTATTPGYQTTAAAPGYQPALAPMGYSASPAPPAYSPPVYSGGGTTSVTIDVPDSQRSPVSCMIAHRWRLTPEP